MQRVPQRIQRQSRLRVRLRREVPSDVRRAVVHDDVVLHAVGRHALELRAAALRRDVVHERRASAYGFDGRQIHADDRGRHRHVLHGNLEPASGGGAQVHARARAAEEVILAVQLHELERRARPEALLFREVVELVCARGRREGREGIATTARTEAGVSAGGGGAATTTTTTTTTRARRGASAAVGENAARRRSGGSAEGDAAARRAARRGVSPKGGGATIDRRKVLILVERRRGARRGRRRRRDGRRTHRGDVSPWLSSPSRPDLRGRDARAGTRGGLRRDLSARARCRNGGARRVSVSQHDWTRRGRAERTSDATGTELFSRTTFLLSDATTSPRRPRRPSAARRGDGRRALGCGHLVVRMPRQLASMKGHATCPCCEARIDEPRRASFFESGAKRERMLFGWSSSSSIPSLAVTGPHTTPFAR